MKRLLVVVALSWLAACEAREPPGGAPLSTLTSTPVGAGADATARDGEFAVAAAPIANLGTLADNLPFEPDGQKLGSIAWHTWIYTDTGEQRTRYGYLRAGAIVDRRGPVIVNSGCEGGWYRINPRGFVCVGKGATLDLQHPVLVASSVRARRGEGLPYLYALADDSPPHLYFKLPSDREMELAEGGVRSRAATWLANARQGGNTSWLQDQAPEFLRELPALTRPYGITRGLHVGAHAGRANRESGFALQQAFVWEGRAFGLTTELDVVPLDRMKVVKPSAFHGAALGPGEDLPVAIVKLPWVAQYRRREDGRFESSGALPKRSVLKLTGQTVGSGAARYFETRDGAWVTLQGLDLIERRETFPSMATGTRKWIDIALKAQTLVAYTGEKADYVTLVSSGAGGLGDPEKVPATIQGTFMIYSKHVSATMDGEEDEADSVELHDVPFAQYFHKGFALHAAYWHDEFGRYRSHGCVNLSPIDSAWLFEWTDPFVPPEWHAVINKERGTVVYIHP
jgi:hypothetical protein